jgi:hypothetical protein
MGPLGTMEAVNRLEWNQRVKQSAVGPQSNRRRVGQPNLVRTAGNVLGNLRIPQVFLSGKLLRSAEK